MILHFMTRLFMISHFMTTLPVILCLMIRLLLISYLIMRLYSIQHFRTLLSMSLHSVRCLGFIFSKFNNKKEESGEDGHKFSSLENKWLCCGSMLQGKISDGGNR